MSESIYGCAVIVGGVAILLAIGEPNIALGGALSLVVGIIFGCVRGRRRESPAVQAMRPKRKDIDMTKTKKKLPKAA